jgi:hypothetical protein
MIASQQQSSRVEGDRTRTGAEDGQTIAVLLKDLRDNLIHLFRQEIALVRGEMAENIKSATRHLVAMAVGGGVALAGAMVLLMGCASGVAVLLTALGLASEHAVWVGPILLGVIVALVGFGILQSARSRLQRTTLVPRRTVQTIKEDSNWAKEKIHRS